MKNMTSRSAILFAALLSLLISAVALAQPAKPIVYVLSTGGTIAGSGSSTDRSLDYKPGAILGEQVVKAVPQIAKVADVGSNKSSTSTAPTSRSRTG